MRYLINWGTHPPKEEVMHKVWERDTASVSAKNETGLHPLALGSNPRAGAGGEILPLVNPAFNKFPNQLSRERRAPPSPSPRILPASFSPPSHSPFPFRPLPGRACSTPRQDPSGSPPSSPKIPPREPQSREKPKWGEGKKETSEPPCVPAAGNRRGREQ